MLGPAPITRSIGKFDFGMGEEIVAAMKRKNIHPRADNRKILSVASQIESVVSSGNK